MKSAILSTSEKAALARFYDTEAHKVLVKLIEKERLELAKEALEQMDITQVRFLHGQAIALKKLVLTIREFYKQSNKEG